MQHCRDDAAPTTESQEPLPVKKAKEKPLEPKWFRCNARGIVEQAKGTVSERFHGPRYGDDVNSLGFFNQVQIVHKSTEQAISKALCEDEALILKVR